MTWDEEAREVLARALYLRQARQFTHPDDVDTPEERWEAGHAPRRAWLSAADALLPDLAPVVAAEVARAEARGKVAALREAADDVDLSGYFPPGWSESVSVECRNAEGAAESSLRFRADAIEAEAGER